jgi:hypothetical protein
VVVPKVMGDGGGRRVPFVTEAYIYIYFPDMMRTNRETKLKRDSSEFHPVLCVLYSRARLIVSSRVD